MAGIGTPQSQAGVMSFYDAQTGGPSMNPKVILIAIVLFAAVVIVFDHFIYAV
ncbi:MAG: preprotein translocase subunit Sec61beta [Candidatus Micrarchaeota archaeon]|nr:preprotein translocase subunit Sec61beta [Candidatus Micrarchaeota archaeon]